MNFKKILALITITAILLTSFVTPVLADKDVTLFINDRQIEFDVPPQIVDGRTMIPFRYVANAFGAEVDYVEEGGKQIITADLRDMHLTMVVGETKATLKKGNEEKVLSFDVAPFIADGGRTLVPARFIAETFGCYVGWNGTDKEVIIIDSAPFIDILEKNAEKLFKNGIDIDFSRLSGKYDFTISEWGESIKGTLVANGNKALLDLDLEGEKAQIFIIDDTAYFGFKGEDLWDSEPLTAYGAPEGLSLNEIKFNGYDVLDFIITQYMNSYDVSKNSYADFLSLWDMIIDINDKHFTFSGTKSTHTMKVLFPEDLSYERKVKNSVLQSATLKLFSSDIDDGDMSAEIKLTRKGNAYSIAVPSSIK